jgi:hypothetical protein
MTRGTIPWQGPDQRWTLFYKYVPHGMHHTDTCYNTTDPALTPEMWHNLPREKHRGILLPENVGMTRMHPAALELAAAAGGARQQLVRGTPPTLIALLTTQSQ